VATATIAGAPLHDATATTETAPSVVPIVAAVRIDEEQYPPVAEFTVRPAEDHAEQEFTHGLADLLDRLANHPGATPDI